MLIWTLTDGKAGDLVQCESVAEAVRRLTGGRTEPRTVRPRPPFDWLAPRGIPDPRDRSALAPPYPGLAVASGRRAVPYLQALRRRSPDTFTVFLKDPRVGAGVADLVWVPEHDALRGPTVLVSPTAPGPVTPEWLAQGRAAARPALLALPAPRVAVLLGGPVPGCAPTPWDLARLAGDLARLARTGAGLMLTPSRRTPPGWTAALAAGLEGLPAWTWDGAGPNPYAEMLGLADALVVTADSTNMLGEAAATGRPVHAAAPAHLGARRARMLDVLRRHDLIHDRLEDILSSPAGQLETLSTAPLNSSSMIAGEIVRRAGWQVA